MKNLKVVKVFKGSPRDNWLEAMIPIQSPGSDFNIIISAVSGGDTRDGIAVDDIVVSSDCVQDSGHTLTEDFTTNTTVVNLTTAKHCDPGL